MKLSPRSIRMHYVISNNNHSSNISVEFGVYLIFYRHCRTLFQLHQDQVQTLSGRRETDVGFTFDSLPDMPHLVIQLIYLKVMSSFMSFDRVFKCLIRVLKRQILVQHDLLHPKRRSPF